MIKSVIQSAFRAIGYRIVPHDRDAWSIYDKIRATPFGTVIDVGAHSGDTVKRWLMDFPKAHIHAIEPLPAAFEKLKLLQAGNKKRVSIWNVAASDSVGEVPFYVHADHPSSSSILPATSYSKMALPLTNREECQVVKAIPLDTLFAEQGIKVQRPLLLKLDVQGAEDRVLRGCMNILAKAEVVIAEVSVVPLYEGQSSFGSIFETMTGVGFSFKGVLEQFHLSDGTPVYFDAVFMREAWNT